MYAPIAVLQRADPPAANLTSSAPAVQLLLELQKPHKHKDTTHHGFVFMWHLRPLDTVSSVKGSWGVLRGRGYLVWD